MIKSLNEQAISALSALSMEDLSHYLKMAKRLQTLGFDGERTSNALCSLIACGSHESIR